MKEVSMSMIDAARTSEGLLPPNVIIGEPIGIGAGHITAENMHDDIVAHETAREILGYMKTVAKDALCGCIDGRLCVHRMDGQERDLRLSVSGGALATMYAGLELLGVDLADPDATSPNRIKVVHNFLGDCGIESAGHCDVANFLSSFKNGTGCGAIDKMANILLTVQQNNEDISKFTQIVRNPHTDDLRGINTAYVPVDRLRNRHTDWRPQAAIGEMKTSSVEVLQSQENSTHGHKELVVIFNDIEDTTLDRDALYESGKQAFDVDVWYLRKMAALAADKLAAYLSQPSKFVNGQTDGKLHNERAEFRRQSPSEDQLLDAFIAYQLATYLVLCDGTQRPIFLLPTDNPDNSTLN